jgi:hypothetical protein
VKYSSGKFSVRIVLSGATLLLAACAAPPADTTPHRVKVTGDNIVEVQKAGYIIMDKNGERLYCTKDPKTGSHIQTTTVCLTARQWEQIHEASVRGLQGISTEVLPPPQH